MTTGKPVSLAAKIALFNVTAVVAFVWEYLSGQPTKVLLLSALVVFAVGNPAAIGFGRRAARRRSRSRTNAS